MATPNFIIAQINPTVGDVDGNLQLIIQACEPHANDENALLIFPELVLTGYPPEDLLLRPAFIERITQATEALVQQSQKWKCGLLIGTPWVKDDLVFNASLLIHQGKIIHTGTKNTLPNYQVFDEKRYFAQGSAPVAFDYLDKRLGVLICADAWEEHNVQLLARQQVDTIIAISASPFHAGKQQERIDLFSTTASKHNIEIVYANLVGGQDDLVFDGGSFAVDHQGNLTHQSSAFEVAVETVGSITPYPDNIESVYKAVSLGLSDYLHKNGLKKVVLGLSGGIDSALVATIAADALGPENVHGILLPSEFTSNDSNEDALALAKNLGISTSVVPITHFVNAAEEELIPELKKLGAETSSWRSNLAIGGNLQARLRGDILMAHSNATGAVLINTSNKSEIAVGYSTLYGDSCGAYSPLKDVYKTEVYALANWRNSKSEVIPQNIINKAPTAELKPEQKDSDQLPDYDILDKILHALIEEGLGVDALTELGFEKETVERIFHLIRLSEHKRRQSPPGPRISKMLFGRDWRYPLTHQHVS